MIGHEIGHHARAFYIIASHGEVREAVERHLFGVAGAAEHHEIVFGHAEGGAEILGTHHVFVGDDAFDGRHDHFVVELHLQALELGFEVG